MVAPLAKTLGEALEVGAKRSYNPAHRDGRPPHGLAKLPVSRHLTEYSAAW